MKKRINGVFSVLMTPFDGNRVDYDVFAKQVQRLSGTDVAGYVVNGSTAEFVHLTKEEKKKLVETVTLNRDPDKLVVVSACEPNIADTYDICAHAAAVNADAMLVCPPYYFKHTTEEIKQYYTELADISPLPVILYNIPFFTQELELGVIYELMNHKNIIGIKDSSGNMKRIMHLIDKAKDTDFSVMTGTDDMLLPAYVGGCTGSMTALATIYPEKITAIYKSVKVGDIEKARVVQHSIMEDLRTADSQSFPEGYKRLMEEVSRIKFGDKEV
ncbi:MAG: dihydrodipicolinate synthase family protein [Clostridia bacterium]|nr:dihydrodipicolinate synthase family protein [Clostridia bacterium]